MVQNCLKWFKMVQTDELLNDFKLLSNNIQFNKVQNGSSLFKVVQAETALNYFEQS